MRSRRRDIRQMRESLPLRAHDGNLMIARMAAGYRRDHPGRQFDVAGHAFEQTRYRREALSDVPIGRAQPLVARPLRDFDFTLLHKDPRARESRFKPARRAPPHNPAAMIEVQMRQQHVRDIARLHPEHPQPIDQPALSMSEDAPLHRAQPIADARIHQDRFAAAHDQRTSKIEADTVLFVGRMLPLPQLARHHPEHAAAVVAPDTIGEKGDSEFADRDFLRLLHRRLLFLFYVSDQIPVSHKPSTSAVAPRITMDPYQGASSRITKGGSAFASSFNPISLPRPITIASAHAITEKISSFAVTMITNCRGSE